MDLSAGAGTALDAQMELAGALDDLEGLVLEGENAGMVVLQNQPFGCLNEFPNSVEFKVFLKFGIHCFRVTSYNWDTNCSGSNAQ